MSLFKDLLQQDVKKVFMNNEEFSEEHIIDDEIMDVIVDSNELIEREKNQKDNMDGVYKKRILIYVKKSQFGSPPKFGSILNLDGKNYTVCDVADECGIYSITLEQNRS